MMSMKADSRMKSNKKAVCAIIGIIVVVFVGWFIWYSWKLYGQKQEAEARLAEAPFAIPADGEDDGIIEYQGEAYERNPSVKAILCIGVDTSGKMDTKTSGDGGQADGIFLAAHDVAAGNVKILMIPRDTMTPITLTDLSGNVLGKDRQHITLAYGYGDGKEQSCERLAEAVSELLSGLAIDHYLAMNTSMIAEMNDLVGGVTVTVDDEGLAQKDFALAKGSTVTLMGKQAEVFVRYRDIDVDNSAISRMTRQQQYIEGYFTAMKQQAARDNQIITKIINTIQREMITDMNKDQYMEMGLAVLENQETLAGGDILMIPGEAVTTELYDEFHHDPEGTLEMVLDLFYRKR